MIKKSILLATLFCMHALCMDSELEPEIKRQKSCPFNPIMSQVDDDIALAAPVFELSLDQNMLDDELMQVLLSSSRNETLEYDGEIDAANLEEDHVDEAVIEPQKFTHYAFNYLLAEPDFQSLTQSKPQEWPPIQNKPKHHRVRPARDKAGNTPLHQAIIEGKTEESLELIQAGADVNAVNNSQQTPLHVAAERNQEDTCTALLDAGAQINETDDEGNIALHNAANYHNYRYLFENGQKQLCLTLIKRGAQVNARNYQQNTPLHLAATHGHLRECGYLIEAGAEINARNGAGETPLHFVARTITHEKGKAADSLCNYFITNRADVHAKDTAGRTPLHEAAAVFLSTSAGSPACICQLLISAGAKTDSKDNNGNSPLHLASAKGSVENCDLLYRAGARLEDRNSAGETPLHRAAKIGRLDIINWLAKHGATIDAVDCRGNTPLYLSLAENELSLKSAELLVNHGANSLTANAEGLTPLDLATKRAYSNLCHKIIKQVIATNWPGIALEQLDPNLLKKFKISKEALSCAFHVAVLNNDFIFAAFLQRAGADPNYKIPGHNALVCAAAFANNVNACVFLSNHGAHMGARTDASKSRRKLIRCTALHILMKHNCLDLFLEQVMATSLQTKINIVQGFINAPVTLLTVFPAVCKRIGDNNNLDTNPVPVPEFKDTWYMVNTMKVNLFKYNLIWSLDAQDEKIEKMHQETRHAVRNLKMRLQQQLHDDICRFDIFQILALKKTFAALEAPFLVEVADLAVHTKEKDMQAPEAASSLPDAEETMTVELTDTTIIIPQSYCLLSNTLRDASQDIDLLQHHIKLQAVDEETWNLIDGQRDTLCKITHISKHETMSLQNKRSSLAPLTKALFDAYKGTPLPALKKLLYAANFLDIKPLLECMSELYARHCSLAYIKQAFVLQSEVDFDTALNAPLGRPKRGVATATEFVTAFLAGIPRDIRELIVRKLHPTMSASIKLR